MTQWPERNVVDTITATDDEIRQALAEAEIPPLLPALAYLTGDLSLLRDDLRPDPLLIAMPQGGLTDEQQAAARALALETLIRYRDGGSKPAPVPADDVLLQIMEFAVGGGGHGRVPAAARGGARATAARIVARRAGTCPTVGTDFTRRDHRRRHVRAAHGPPPAAGRRAVRHPREERRRRRHVVREHVSGLPRRQPEPQLQLLVRAAPRLAVPLLDAGRAARLLPHAARTRSACASTSASRPRCCRRRGTTTTIAGRSRAHGPDGTDETLRANAVISAVGQLNRPKLPDIAGRDSLRRGRPSTRRGGTTTSTSPASGSP